ncbi:MAG TPA: DUF4268 domain-containing protein, partial [Candidatus Tectomicrobia bacterium]
MSYNKSAELAFWDNITPLRSIPDTESFVRGFADGASAVWLEVKDHVTAGDPVSQELSASDPLVDHPIDIEDSATTVQKTPHAQVTPSPDALSFWRTFLANPQLQGTPHAGLSPHDKPWLFAKAGREGLTYNYNIKASWTDVELFINHTDKQQNYPVFAALQQQQAEIEKHFGRPLQWIGSAKNNGCHIRFILKEGTYRETERWPKLHAAMIDKMQRLIQALK